MKNLRISMLALMAATVLSLTACDEIKPTANDVQRHQQERLSQESNAQVGMPAITKFAEKRMMKMVLEKRDDATLITLTYVMGMDGKYHKVCDSLGYGLPYATQFTNPQMIAYRGSQVGVATLPQADPNGLYSPTSADGTWVMCINPKNKTADVQYIEDRVGVFTFPPMNVAKD